MPLLRLTPAEGHEIIVGDVRAGLAEIPSGIVQLCCTSPPYWGLRSYGTEPQVWGGDQFCQHVWEVERTARPNASDGPNEKQDSNAGSRVAAYDDRATYSQFCQKCNAWRGELGSEPTPELFIEHLVEVFRCVRRVLRDDGCLAVNIGDSYAASGMGGNPEESPFRKQATNVGSLIQGHRCPTNGLKPKDLVGVPWMLAFALRKDGWYLRSECPWFKRSPMPESVDDRPSKALEYVFLLSKNQDYFFDMEAVKVASIDPESINGRNRRFEDKFVQEDRDGKARTRSGFSAISEGTVYSTRNFRSADLWFESIKAPHGLCIVGDDLVGIDVTNEGTPDAHFATYPMRIVSPFIKACTSQFGSCPKCGAPWERIVERNRIATRPGEETKVTGDTMTDGNRDPQRHITQTKTIGARATCQCNAEGDPVPCVVLDPFLGSGTTSKCARILGRHSIGCELNEKYAREIAMAKIADAFEEKRRPKAKAAVGQKSIFDD